MTTQIKKVIKKQQQVPPAPRFNSGVTQPVKVEPACNICNDFGVYRLDLPVGHPQFGKLQICECRKQTQVKELARHSRLTETELKYSLEMLSVAGRPGTLQMVHAARAFVAKPEGMLTISGGFGNGKTTALMSIVNACIAKDVPAVYITFYDLIGYVKEAFTNDGDTEWERVNKLARVPVLCIDEIDKVKNTDWVQQTITHLLDVRYRQSIAGNVGTVLAFNGIADEIPHKWIVSRMKEGVVVFNGDQDVRPQIGKERAKLAGKAA